VHVRTVISPLRSLKFGLECGCVTTAANFWHDLIVSAEGKPEVIAALRQLVSEWRAGPPDGWENWTIPAYLEAMARLEVYEHAYINTGRPVPVDGWTVFAQTVGAAAVYE
jgi:hypothetical protein